MILSKKRFYLISIPNFYNLLLFRIKNEVNKFFLKYWQFKYNFTQNVLSFDSNGNQMTKRCLQSFENWVSAMI